MIDAIGKLRESSHLDDSKWTLETGEVIHVYGSEPNDPNAVNWGEQWRKIADEIEHEIAEKYQLLPVDADGVPIHVHDWIEVHDEKQRVAAVATGSVFWWEEDGCHWTQSFMCRRVKPRTLEDIVTEAIEYGHGIYPPTHCHDAKVDELCAEIRELMEVDR